MEEGTAEYQKNSQEEGQSAGTGAYEKLTEAAAGHQGKNCLHRISVLKGGRGCSWTSGEEQSQVAEGAVDHQGKNNLQRISTQKGGRGEAEHQGGADSAWLR